MIGSLDAAIKNEEPIIVTGWNPHWKFSAYDLKYLEDPKGTFGGSENINTIVRKGLEEDMPNAYKILDRFNWEPQDMEAVMFDAQEVSFEEAANNWIEENPDKVAQWTEGVEKVDGKEIELVSTPWDSERASSRSDESCIRTTRLQGKGDTCRSRHYVRSNCDRSSGCNRSSMVTFYTCLVL